MNRYPYINDISLYSISRVQDDMTQPQLDNTWRRVGAWSGGLVSAVAISPTYAHDGLALAATTAGMFRSTDGGLSWQPANAGLTDRSVLTVAFAPANRGAARRAFATTEGSRLFTTADGGAQWEEQLAWAGLGQVTQLVVSPNFAADQTLFVATDEGVFRSQDGGASWESSTFGLHDVEVAALACAPDYAASDVLWAGTINGGLYRSRNGARSWRDSGHGLPDDAFTALLVSPAYADDQTLYVGTEAHGLYRSGNGGATWAPVAHSAGMGSILSLGAAGNRLLAGSSEGLHVSDDGGRSWTQAAAFRALELATAPDGVVLAAAEDGLYRSPDGGATWARATTGIVAHAPPVAQRSGRGELCALDRAGRLAHSANDGEDWAELAVGDGQSSVAAFAIAEGRDGSRLLVATEDGALFAGPLDRAAPSWGQPVAHAPADRFFLHLLALPGLTGEVLLADDHGRLYHWAGGEEAVVLAGPTPWAGETLLHLACAPGGRRLLAASGLVNTHGHYTFHLWETDSDGDGWSQLAELESELPSIAVAWPDDPHERSLVVATRNRVIRVFQPRGEGELASAQRFLPAEANVTALAASPAFATDRQLWAATNCGVYHSADAGVTWAACGEALAGQPVVAIFVTEAEVIAIELGGTVWKMSRAA